MKRLVSLILASVASVTLLISPLTQSGCASNKTVYRTSSTAKVTADAAMRTWGAYVKQFHPPVEQERQVKSAFEKYQAAQLLVLDAAIVYRQVEAAGGDKTAAQAKLDAAVAGASAALSGLVGLIKSFGGDVINLGN